MAMKLGEGDESYAPLPRLLLGGLVASVALTVSSLPPASILPIETRLNRTKAPAEKVYLVEGATSAVP